MGVHVLKEKGLFLGFFGICTPIGLNGQNDVLFDEKCIRLVCEKLTIFSYKMLFKTSFFGFLTI